MNAIYSSHNIEHVFPHEVPIVLKEFFRVLKEDGMVVICCPDLQSVCEAVVNDKLLEPLYTTPEGHPISPIDISNQSIYQNNRYMQTVKISRIGKIQFENCINWYSCILSLHRPKQYFGIPEFEVQAM